MNRLCRMLPVLLVAPICCAGLVGCGQGTSTGPTTGASAVPGTTTTASQTATSTRRHAVPHRHKRKPVAHPAPSPVGGLAYSTASAQIVQPQPAAGSCHALGTGLYSRPDPRCTPGALNPGVTQATIHQTICVTGWTSTVRPPESVTEPEKQASMAAYGDTGSMSEYEYDHFVPLELGGAVNDPRNLWPEPGVSPNPKDDVELSLRDQVCDGQMPLAQAQRAITHNWVKLSAGAPTGSSTGAPSPAPSTTPTSGECSVSAAYSSRYSDWDVYLHSNQPETTVTVSDDAGRTASWHTDSSGYADVYFKAPGSAAGETVTVHAGAATCQTTL